MTRPLICARRLGPAVWRLGLRLGLGLLMSLVMLASVWHASVLAWDGERILLAARRYGPQATEAVQLLQGVVQQALTTKDDWRRLSLINTFFNQRIQYRDDIDVWGQVDYWASPLEALQKGAGDCEDYAIGKYFTLVAMGVPHRQLRMVYVRADRGGGLVQPHMVLAFYPTPTADPWVLDSLIPDVRRASQRPDLQPVFSFNADALWEGSGGVTLAGHPAERLSRWREVLQKARQEGFF